MEETHSAQLAPENIANQWSLLNTSDWRNWLILFLILGILWIARPYLHQFIKTIFNGLGAILTQSGNWCSEHGLQIFHYYSSAVSSYRGKQFEQKMLNHESKLAKRDTKLSSNLVNLAQDLEMSVQKIEGASSEISNINLPETTIEAVSTSIKLNTEAKDKARLQKTVNSVKQAVSAEIQNVRPAINKITSQIPTIEKSIEHLKNNAVTMNQSAISVNKDFQEFEEIVKSNDHLELVKKQSIVVPWLLAFIVMSVALSGVFLNFFLIQRPMAEIVGDDLNIMGVGLPTAAAFVVILLEFVVGVILMDAIGVTEMTPIAHTSKSIKKALFWIAILFLTAFSLFEAFLALQREVLIDLELETTMMALGEGMPAPGNEEHEATGPSMTLIAQIILATMIPWLLAVAAVPLETVVQLGTFIALLIAHQLLMITSFVLKNFGLVLSKFGEFLLSFYDLIIFLPLALEKLVKTFQSSSAKQS